MTTTTKSTIRNGVDATTMYATLDAIKAQPELAKFQFRASEIINLLPADSGLNAARRGAATTGSGRMERCNCVRHARNRLTPSHAYLLLLIFRSRWARVQRDLRIWRGQAWSRTLFA